MRCHAFLFFFLLISSELELHKLASSISSEFLWCSSVQQCSSQHTYAVARLPLFLAPCFDSQSSSSFITLSLLLQQCPINHNLLISTVPVILGKAAVQLLVGYMLLPGNSKNCSKNSCVRTIQTVPHLSSHRPAFITIKHYTFNLTRKKPTLRWFCRFVFQSFIIVLSAPHACPVLIFVSFPRAKILYT